MDGSDIQMSTRHVANRNLGRGILGAKNKFRGGPGVTEEDGINGSQP